MPDDNIFFFFILWTACIKQLMEGKSMNNRFSQNIPNLGGIQPAANSVELDEPNTGDRQSLIGRNNECVICMDNQRGKNVKGVIISNTTRQRGEKRHSLLITALCLDCVLHPCHHLCVCIKCGRLLLKRTDSCPICRRPISNAFRIYHS